MRVIQVFLTPEYKKELIKNLKKCKSLKSLDFFTKKLWYNDSRGVDAQLFA